MTRSSHDAVYPHLTASSGRVSIVLAACARLGHGERAVWLLDDTWHRALLAGSTHVAVPPAT